MANVERLVCRPLAVTERQQGDAQESSETCEGHVFPLRYRAVGREPIVSPARGIGNDRVLAFDMRPDRLDQRRIAAIAGGDQAVADHSRDSDALDRRAGEEGAEGGIVEREQVGEARRLKSGRARNA